MSKNKDEAKGNDKHCCVQFCTKTVYSTPSCVFIDYRRIQRSERNRFHPEKEKMNIFLSETTVTLQTKAHYMYSEYNSIVKTLRGHLWGNFETWDCNLCHYLDGRNYFPTGLPKTPSSLENIRTGIWWKSWWNAEKTARIYERETLLEKKDEKLQQRIEIRIEFFKG